MGGAWVLGQSGGAGATQALFWIGVLIAAVLVASVGVLLLRRRLFSRGGDAGGDPGSILESMRAMRDRGEMSAEEFERARAALVRRASGETGPTPTARPVPTPEDLRAPEGFDLTGEPLPRAEDRPPE